MDAPGTYADHDRRLLNNPDFITKVRKRFSKTPFVFDLYFINRKGLSYLYSSADPHSGKTEKFFSSEWEADQQEIGGIRTPAELRQFLGHEIKPNPGAISVVFLSNASDTDPIRLSPWMVAHRIGHAITDSEDMPPAIQQALDLVPQGYLLTKEFGDKAFQMKDMLTMRSARTGNLQFGEVREETIAQFIIEGKVTLRIPDGYQVHNQKLAQVNLRRMEDHLNQVLERLMARCLGHLFVAV